MAKKITQRDRILQYMRENNGITAYEAVVEVGCTQLSARICELEKDGYMFSTEVIKTRNRYNEPCRFLKYRYVGNVNDIIDKAKEKAV